MKHRRRTGPAARGRAASAALGVLLTCAAVAGTSVAAAGGAGRGADRDPAADVVQIARQQIGDSYVWGGNGPDGWDCSGLTSYMWREVGGVEGIPRVSRDQQAWAVPIPREQLLPGDLVFWGEPVNHVALYAGQGVVVDAASSRRGVVERAIWKADVVRYGRVPRPGMPAVKPWTPPAPSPSPAAAAKPASKPSGPAKPTARPTGATAPDSASLVAAPLRGLPAPDLPALTTIAARSVQNALSVRGSKAWTDLALVQAAWRHAGGGLLPADRTQLVAAGTRVPIGAARIGDLVVYGDRAATFGLYLGHGYLVYASPSLGRVVVRRVFVSPSVRIVRLDVR